MTAVMVSVIPAGVDVAEQAKRLATALDGEGHQTLFGDLPTPYLKPHDTMGLYLFAVRLGSSAAAHKVRTKIRSVWPKAEIETAIAKTCGAEQQMFLMEQASEAHEPHYTPVVFSCVLEDGHGGHHVTERPEGRVEFEVRGEVRS